MARRRVDEPPRSCEACREADAAGLTALERLCAELYCECDGPLPVEPDPRATVLREVADGA